MSGELPTLGFVTVCEHEELGLIGGCLVLNTAGRPLEFHCTTPVKPNRALEILYGPTLKPFLYGEQIAATLVNKAKGRPLFLCTDNEFVAAVRMQSSCPVLLVLNDGAELPNPALWRGFEVASTRAAVWKRWPQDEAAVLEAARPFADHFDFGEPFQRIREALEEARKSARPAA